MYHVSHLFESFHHSKLKNTVAVKAFHSLIERLAGSKTSFISNIIELRSSSTTVGKTNRKVDSFRDRDSVWQEDRPLSVTI